MSDALLHRLHEHLAARADESPPLALLQPAEPFLDTVGEAMRRRLFVTQAGGRTLCLRPEFTIPLCRHHIEADTMLAMIYSASGTVFRQDRAREEFPQAGLELLGHTNTARADAAALAHMLDALALGGLSDAVVTVGDKALFASLLNGLALSETWRARLLRAFGDVAALDALIDNLASPPEPPRTAHEKLALAGNHERLCAEVVALMKAGGLSPSQGRDPAVVAARMIERTRDRQVRLDPFALHVLRSFLAIDQPLESAARSLETLADQSGLDLQSGLKAFGDRLDALERIDLGRFHFRAGFGRPLDYYTGLLFEARALDAADDGPAVAGGGRYDRLCSGLGAPAPIPAVGFTVAVDVLAGGT